MKFGKLVKLAAVCMLATVGSGCSLIPSSLSSIPGQYLGDQLHISADFENTAGVYAGNEVDVLGVQVGTIGSIEPKGTYARVTMLIDRGVRLPADVKAAIVNPQLITNRHIELAPAYTSGPAMRDNGYIPMPRTRVPVELDQILKTFDQIGASLKGDNQTGPMASRVLFPLLNGNGDKLKDTLTALSQAFETTFANKDQISNSIVKLNDITQVIAKNDQTVRDFSGRITELVSLLGQQSPGLRAVLQQLDDFVANTATVVGQNKDQLGGALQRFVAITNDMRANARNLTEVVDVGPMMFQNLANATSFDSQALRLHGLLDKSVLDGEILSQFCQRIGMRLDGCRTGKVADLGPDLGLTAALLGITGK